MNWSDVLKVKAISISPKMKTHSRKPKSEGESGKCKAKLQEYVDKLKNMPFTLDEKVSAFDWGTIGVKLIEKEEENQDITKWKTLEYELKADRWPKRKLLKFTEQMDYLYEPDEITEEEACFILEQLMKLKKGDLYTPNKLENLPHQLTGISTRYLDDYTLRISVWKDSVKPTISNLVLELSHSKQWTDTEDWWDGMGRNGPGFVNYHKIDVDWR
jgi:hypothetical protein